MTGIGREWGMLSVWPPWRHLNKHPASMRAFLLNGGDLTSPLIQTSGLSAGFSWRLYVINDI